MRNKIGFVYFFLLFNKKLITHGINDGLRLNLVNVHIDKCLHSHSQSVYSPVCVIHVTVAIVFVPFCASVRTNRAFRFLNFPKHRL